jgi:hypothetical protein
MQGMMRRTFAVLRTVAMVAPPRVLGIFIACQKLLVERIATSGLKG